MPARNVLTCAAVLLCGSAAHAQPAPPTVVFDKVTIETVTGSVYARRGGIVARLEGGALAGPPVVDAKARTLSFATESDCGATRGPFTFGFDQLTARLDNVVAYREHKQKHFAESREGFAKALAMDPTNRVVAVNLASAQQLLGDNAAAVATLAPWLASEPVAMYATIVADPELAPLLGEPAVAAVKAHAAGDAAVAVNKFETIAYAPERKLLAVGRTECGWGADGPDACRIDIEVFDATTGKQVTSLPLTVFDRTNRAVTTERARVAQQTLRDLGFSVTRTMLGKDTATDADRQNLKRKSSFPELKLGIVDQEGSVNVLRGDRVLAHAETLRHAHEMLWVPAAHAFVLGSSRAGSEGCEGTDPTLTTVIPIAATDLP